MTSNDQASDVATYAASVRAALSDLPSDQADVLLEDLEDHLTEIAADAVCGRTHHGDRTLRDRHEQPPSNPLPGPGRRELGRDPPGVGDKRRPARDTRRAESIRSRVRRVRLTPPNYPATASYCAIRSCATPQSVVLCRR